MTEHSDNLHNTIYTTFLLFQEEERETVAVLPATEQTTGPQRVDDDKRTTTPYMTKYERARVLGTRALQIALVFDTCFFFLQPVVAEM